MEKTGVWMMLLLFLIPLAYGVQVNSSTEIYTFNVTGCQANESVIGCLPANVRFSCDISNYQFIDYTLFRIAGTDYLADRALQNFYYDWQKGMTPSTINTTINFDRGTIHDVSSGTALFFPAVSVRLDCKTCDRTVINGTCEINDTMLVQYIGDGSGNCTSFNMTESCDYCIPLWQITSTCSANNTEFRTYADSNNCFSATGLYSDSCDASFTDCNQNISCGYLSSQMDCDYDINPLIDVIGNRLYWKCTMNSSITDYSCISYVKQEGFIVQTNPQQKTYSSGLIPREQESREFFVAQNGLVNPYFTTENLKSNVSYVFGVQCSYQGGKLTTEHYVTPLYKNLDELASRTIWVKDNSGYLIGALIFLVVIGFLVAWVVRR